VFYAGGDFQRVGVRVLRMLFDVACFFAGHF
jgi:hypothetical protein